MSWWYWGGGSSDSAAGEAFEALLELGSCSQVLCKRSLAEFRLLLFFKAVRDAGVIGFRLKDLSVC